MQEFCDDYSQYISVDISADFDKLAQMLTWVAGKDVVYLDSITNEGLDSLSSLFGATYSKTFLFKNQNDAMMFKLKWC